MKTYPINRPDGFLHAFEISNVFISMGAIRRTLFSVSGVTNVKRVWFRDVRLTFDYQGAPFEVWEPYGDNSRYWIGSCEAADHSIDVRPIHDAFARYQFPMVRLARILMRRGLQKPT